MPEIKNSPINKAVLPLILIAVAALTVVFFVAASDFGKGVKIFAFLAGIAALVALGLIFLKFQPEQPAEQEETGVFDPDIIEKLIVLEEAAEFFGASLKPAEMFRLIAGRIGELIRFDAAALFLPETPKKQLKIAYVEGEAIAPLKNAMINFNSGLAAKVFLSRRLRLEEKIVSDREMLPLEALDTLKATVAAPLCKGEQIFAVLQLYSANAEDFNEIQLKLLEAVAARVAPLMKSSLVYESNLSNSLTDALTNLPNERAFYLVLENQIAETLRLPVKRNLSILVADIRGFSAINQRYGHANGDLVLNFVAELLKDQLRRMDFLSRTTGDEFYAVLPTASEDVALSIVSRIEEAFERNVCRIPELEDAHLKLNFGTATFYNDGETAQELLQAALLRKQQEKLPPDQRRVQFFPQPTE